MEFTTQVDGEPVASKAEKKAFLFGTDVTSKLELSDIPLNPDEAVNALETISQETKSKLKHFELLDDNGSPTWTAKTTYYWQQLFPAGRQISIEHRYKPTVEVPSHPQSGHRDGSKFVRPTANIVLTKQCLAPCRPRAPSNSRLAV